MTYPDGTTIRIGDRITYHCGEFPAQIVSIIESDQDLLDWDMEYPGVLIRCDRYGLIFIEAEEFAWEGTDLTLTGRNPLALDDQK